MDLELIFDEINVPANRGARASREQCLGRSLVPRHQQTMLLAVPWLLGPLSTLLPRSRLPIRPMVPGLLDFKFVSIPCSLERKGKMVPRIPWFQGPVAPIDQSRLEPKVNKAPQKPSPLAPSRHSALVTWSLVARHQAGNDALVPRFLGLTFSREQGTVAAGCPRSPWKLGPLVPGPATDPGFIANLMTWSLIEWNLITGNCFPGRARLRPSRP